MTDINNLSLKDDDTFIAINLITSATLKLKTIIYVKDYAELDKLVDDHIKGKLLTDSLYKITCPTTTSGLPYIFCSQKFMEKLFLKPNSDEILDGCVITRPDFFERHMLADAISYAYINRENDGDYYA